MQKKEVMYNVSQSGIAPASLRSECRKKKVMLYNVSQSGIAPASLRSECRKKKVMLCNVSQGSSSRLIEEWVQNE